MARSRPVIFLASTAVIPLAALTVAACSSGGAATASPPKTSAGASATVGVATLDGNRGAAAAVDGFAADRLFEGQSPKFFRTLHQLARDADAAARKLG